MSTAQYRLLSPAGQVSESGQATVSVSGGALVLTPGPAPAGAVLRIPFGQITAVTEPEPFVIRVEFAARNAVELSRLGVIRTQLLAELRDGMGDSAAAAAGAVGEAAAFDALSAGARAEVRVYDDALLITGDSGSERISFSFITGVQVQDYVLTVQAAGRSPVVLSRLGRRTTELCDLLAERLREARGRTAAFLGALLPGLDPIAVRSAAALLRDGVAASAPELDAIHPGLTGNLLRIATLPARLDGALELAGLPGFAIGFKQLASIRRPAAGVTPWHDHAAQPHIGAHDSTGGSFGQGLTGVLTASVVENIQPGGYGEYWAFRALGAGLAGRGQQRPVTPRPDVTRGLLTPATEDLAALTAAGDHPAVLAFALCGGRGRVIFEVLNLPGLATYVFAADDPGGVASVNRVLDDAGFVRWPALGRSPMTQPGGTASPR